MKVGWIAKSVTEKNNRRVDCAEAGKKTVQAMRYEWWGFLPAGDCTAELPVINFQAKPDRFNYSIMEFIFKLQCFPLFKPVFAFVFWKI